jgi:hypothetical protein
MKPGGPSSQYHREGWVIRATREPLFLFARAKNYAEAEA